MYNCGKGSLDMKQMINIVIQILLTGILLLAFTIPGFAEVNIVPGKASVEQGFQLLTLDVEGAENFRFTGRKDGIYHYQGKILPGSKLKIVFKASLLDEKKLPLTGRSCVLHIKVTARKDREKGKKAEVIETKTFSRENKSNLFLNYTAPQDANTLIVDETFELYNDSKNEKFNKKVTSRNRLFLSTKDAAKGTMADLIQKSGIKIVDDSDGKANVGGVTKDNSKTKPKSGKIDTGSIDMESKESNTGMYLAIATVILLAAGAGAFFFMKQKKAAGAVDEEAEQKERQRQQEIQRQQELQEQQAAQKKQELRRIYKEMEQRNKKLAEERAREQERKQEMSYAREAEQRQAAQQETLRQNSVSHNVGNAAKTAVPPGGTAPVRFCSNCGAKLEDDSAFCENCGAKV